MLNFRLVRHLWYFSVVAEEGNFRRAAERLGISQPPLSQQIKVLETTLRLKLFDRSKRETTLTPAGAAILPEVQRLIEQSERLNLLVGDARRGRLDRVSIGANTSLIVHILPDVIAGIRQRFPNATISMREMSSSDALDALERGEIELAFGRFNEVRKPLKLKNLATDRLDVALPHGHPLLEKKEVHVSDLADMDWIHFPRRTNPQNFDIIAGACLKNGFTPRITHQVTNQLSLMAFVACDLGFAFLPHSITPFFQGYVEFRRLQPDIQIVTTAAAWKTDTPLIGALVELAGKPNAQRSPLPERLFSKSND